MADLASVLAGGALAILGGFASNWLLESSRSRRERRALVLAKLEEAYGLAHGLPKWAADLMSHSAYEVLRAFVAERDKSNWKPQEFLDSTIARHNAMSSELNVTRIATLIGFHYDALLKQTQQLRLAASELAQTILDSASKVLDAKSQDEAIEQYNKVALPAVKNFTTQAYSLANAIQAEAKKIR